MFLLFLHCPMTKGWLRLFRWAQLNWAILLDIFGLIKISSSGLDKLKREKDLWKLTNLAANYFLRLKEKVGWSLRYSSFLGFFLDMFSHSLKEILIEWHFACLRFAS